MHSLSQYGSIFCCTLAPSIRCLYLVLSTVEYWKLHTVTLLPWAGNGTDFWWEQYTISVYSNSIHTRDTINLCLMHLWDCYSVRTTFTSGQEEGHGARSGDVNGPIQDDNKWRFNPHQCVSVSIMTGLQLLLLAGSNWRHQSCVSHSFKRSHPSGFLHCSFFMWIFKCLCLSFVQKLLNVNLNENQISNCCRWGGNCCSLMQISYHSVTLPLLQALGKPLQLLSNFQRGWLFKNYRICY